MMTIRSMAFLLAHYYLLLLPSAITTIGVSGFQIIESRFSLHTNGRQASRSSSSVVFAKTNGEEVVGNQEDDDDNDDDSSSNILSSSSRLSHVMLQVPSVDKTVQYWKETANGRVTASSKLDKTNDKDNNADELRSAFVALGNGRDDTDLKQNCFALELVKNKHKSFQLGNAVKYIGVSKLVGYTSKEDLIGMIMAGSKRGTKDSTTKEEEEQEPNGIDIQSCASAPGDYFARFCLHTTNMEATTTFYADIFGMNIAAIDEKMLCLRYDESSFLKPPKNDNNNNNNNNKKDKKDKNAASSSSIGVPTTLVFEPLSSSSSIDTTTNDNNNELQQGNCFDHLVIATKANIDQVYTQIQQSLADDDNDLGNLCPMFMKPTEMFGQKVFGVLDPNGYKIIVAGKAE